MLRAIKRWLSAARNLLRRWLWFERRRRTRQGRFQPPRRRLVSRLLLTFRAYRLYLPAGVSPRDRLPLLVMLHGCSQDAGIFAEGTRMNELADRHGFIVLYPEQSRTANSYGCWNWFQPSVLEGGGEASAIVRIVRKVARNYPVDTTRVYVAGMSAGGAMASVLANRHGDLFAACAIHSGLMYRAAVSASAAAAAMRGRSLNSPQEAARRSAAFVPTLVIHGDSDKTVDPVNADQIVEQVQALMDILATPPGPLVAGAPRRVARAGRPYEQRDYERNGRIVLRKIVVEDLDHAWSGGDGRHPFNDPQGPDASRLIWDFVKDFRRLPDGSHEWRRSFSFSAIWDWLRRK
jgi:poly(hydroxyalkanoate) depolymerase family esterase